ncbi:MAG: hypothetical protein CFH41_01113 [Alphaproteobacteria bacterium MarineAlpha11_Bin1]|nr:MAG: hypothetical protein CFH41_01113 [Alphaproteobacteria bacterium MarineAlpha11_Bin1]
MNLHFLLRSVGSKIKRKQIRGNLIGTVIYSMNKFHGQFRSSEEDSLSDSSHNVVEEWLFIVTRLVTVPNLCLSDADACWAQQTIVDHITDFDHLHYDTVFGF